MILKNIFDKCVEVKLMKDATIEVHCKLGLWSVCGGDVRVVTSEAQRYWSQYYNDGEYDELLSKTKDYK